MTTRAALAFLDTETTDLDELRGRIWECGMILRGPEQDDEIPHVFHIDGISGGEFHPKAREISRWNERYMMDARVIAEETAVQLLASSLAGRHIVGANPAFDQAHLKQLFRRHAVAPTWHHRLIDVEVLAMQALGCPTPMGLRQSAEALGLMFNEEDLHSAYGDAVLAKRIYDHVVHGIDGGVT